MMLWSIRNQILVPLIAIQSVAVATVAVTAATLAARRSEQQIIGRLNSVIDTLGHSNFPYTPSVLTKMRGLSGAHFAVFTNDGRVTDATLPSLKALPAAVRAVRPTGPPRFARRIIHAVPGRHPLFRRAAPDVARAGQSIAPGALPRDQLAAGEMGGRNPSPGPGGGHARPRGGRHELDRPPHQRADSRAAAAGGENRGRRLRGIRAGATGDEVQDLAGSINRMCNQLKQMQQTIRQSERTRLLAQLAAGLAHQLRNSLTGARMSVQLHAKRFPPQDGDETLDVALRQLAMTEEQVKGLLSLGRVERQPHAPCELGRLLGDVALLVKPSCQHAKVHLRHRAGDDPLHVMADEAGLRAAVLNLTMNAVEAAGPGGEVDLGASTDHGEVTIEVSDTGTGPAAGSGREPARAVRHQQARRRRARPGRRRAGGRRARRTAVVAAKWRPNPLLPDAPQAQRDARSRDEPHPDRGR